MRISNLLCTPAVRGLPGLVSPAEIDTLRQRFALAASGRGFVLQAGDCAERFADCQEGPIRRQLRALLVVARVLEAGVRVPVTVVGRIAGQYGKPRSTDVCMHNGGTPHPAARGSAGTITLPCHGTHNPLFYACVARTRLVHSGDSSVPGRQRALL